MCSFHSEVRWEVLERGRSLEIRRAVRRSKVTRIDDEAVCSARGVIASIKMWFCNGGIDLID